MCQHKRLSFIILSYPSSLKTKQRRPSSTHKNRSARDDFPTRTHAQVHGVSRPRQSPVTEPLAIRHVSSSHLNRPVVRAGTLSFILTVRPFPKLPQFKYPAPHFDSELDLDRTLAKQQWQHSSKEMRKWALPSVLLLLILLSTLPDQGKSRVFALILVLLLLSDL